MLNLSEVHDSYVPDGLVTEEWASMLRSVCIAHGVCTWGELKRVLDCQLCYL